MGKQVNKTQIVAICRETTSARMTALLDAIVEGMTEDLFSMPAIERTSNAAFGCGAYTKQELRLAQCILNSEDTGAWGELTDKAMSLVDDYSNANYIERLAQMGRI